MLLPLVLVALLGFAAQRQWARLVAGPDVCHLLLRIIAEYELPYKRLAGTGRLSWAGLMAGCVGCYGVCAPLFAPKNNCAGVELGWPPARQGIQLTCCL